MPADDELQDRISGIEAGVSAMIQGGREMTDVLEMLGGHVAELVAEMQKPPDDDFRDILERLLGSITGLADHIASIDRKLDALPYAVATALARAP